MRNKDKKKNSQKKKKQGEEGPAASETSPSKPTDDTNITEEEESKSSNQLSTIVEGKTEIEVSAEEIKSFGEDYIRSPLDKQEVSQESAPTQKQNT